MFELLSFISNYLHLFVLHICSSGTFPKPLSEKDERKYLEQWALKGDISARNILVEHNLRLVAHIIKKYYSVSSNQDDLVSIGTIGLIKSINTFDINKSIKLSSYASRCIENEILMYFRSSRKSSGDISLNEAIETDKDGNPLSLIDILSCEDNVIDELDSRMKCSKLNEYIEKSLDAREKQIICLRYGLNGREPLTQREIAQKFDISRSYVSRIEKKALQSLRKCYDIADREAIESRRKKFNN